jgi:DHA1 family multidrug resistance protein-like MFS transporter
MRDTRSGSWVWVLMLFTAATLVLDIFGSQVSAFTPLYLPHLGIAPDDVKGWTGVIGAISSGIGLPFLPFWGALADRYSRQPLIVRTFVVHLIAGTLALLAGNIWVFVLARTVMSFALGSSGLMMTTLAERTPQRHMGLAFSILNGSGPLGTFLGPLIGGPIVDAWGFPALLALDTALMLGVILALTLGYRDRFVSTNRGSIGRMAWESVTIIGRSPRLRTLFPALFLLFSGAVLVSVYLPLVVGALYTGSDLGTVIGLVLGAGGLTTLILSPLLGALADRLGHWRMLFAGATVMLLLCPLPFFTRDLLVFTVLWAAISGVWAAVLSLSFSVLSQSIAADVRGRVMIFAYLPVNLAGTVGSALGSIVTQGSIFAVFPTAAVLTALGIGALALAQRQAVLPAGAAEA